MDADDLLNRARRRASIDVANQSEEVATFSTGDMKHGRIPVYVRVGEDVLSSRRQRIVASLALEPATYLTDSRDMACTASAGAVLGH